MSEPNATGPFDTIHDFRALKRISLAALSSTPADKLDSKGLAYFYIALAPITELNQCVAACTTLKLALERLDVRAEVVPTTVEFPWTNEEIGTPTPHLLSDGATDGHVVLVTDRDEMIDPTAAQFTSLKGLRNGLPTYVGPANFLWEDTLATREGVSRHIKSTRFGVSIDRFHTITYELHDPSAADPLVDGFINTNKNALEDFVEHLLERYTWILANNLLTGPRTTELGAIRSSSLTRLVRLQTGQPLEPC